MLELYKQPAVVRSPLDKDRVGRVPGKPPGIIKIESTDKSIDRLVYKLYGLTDDEINIVEDKK